MKTTKLTTIILLSMLLLSVVSRANGVEESGTIVKKPHNVEAFTKINIGGAFNVTITEAENCTLTVEADENIQQYIVSSISNNTLTVKLKGAKLKKIKTLSLHITLPKLEKIKASGAADIKATGFTCEKLSLISSGAAELKVSAIATIIKANSSGASELTIKGSTNQMVATISGASEFNAEELECKIAEFQISGAAEATVNVTDNLVADISGAGEFENISEAKQQVIKKGDNALVITTVNGATISTNESNTEITTYSQGDTTDVTIGGIGVTVIEDDSVRVKVGRYQVRVDDNGNVNFDRIPRHKFNGHWGGFGLGLNGYVNSDFNMDFAPADKYLDLEMAKSISVHLNLIEQNFSLTRNQKLGVLTGLGLEWHNYHFSNSTYLETSSGTTAIEGYYIDGISIKKSKLLVVDLVVPAILEFQTKSGPSSKSAHIGVGVIGGLRIGSHSKIYYNNTNTVFNLLDENGTFVKTETSTSNAKYKERNDFHLNPFKLDATVRIGWGIINIWGNYSLIEMFKKNQGPELYPWSIGITLLSW